MLWKLPAAEFFLCEVFDFCEWFGPKFFSYNVAATKSAGK